MTEKFEPDLGSQCSSNTLYAGEIHLCRARKRILYVRNLDSHCGDADVEARYGCRDRKEFHAGLRRRVSQMNPNPDYDASDELEYGIVAWLLRGVYPPPSYAPDLGNAAGG
jgi:hypothetical protein